MSATPDKNELGQFMPGNRWMMPRWVKGESGKPAKYTPTKLWYAVKEYVEAFTETEQELVIASDWKYTPKRLTWAGLANHLGMTRQGLDRYAKGEVGKTEDDKLGVVAVLGQYKTLMESDLEQRLTDKGFATQGVIFSLKNHHGWRDEKHLNVNTEEKQTLIVNVDPALAAKIQGEVIEGEYVQLHNDGPENAAFEAVDAAHNGA